MAQSGLRFSLHVPGVDEQELAVTRFTHTERFPEPFTLDVAFASRNDAMSAEERRDVTSARRNGEELRRINGIFTRFHRGYRRTCCEVVIRPALRRLSLLQGCHIVQGWNARESITQQCGEAGITDIARAVKVRCGSA